MKLMDRDEMLKVIEDSFSRPSATPCTWRDDRDTYIEEEKRKLRGCLIEPLKVRAVACGWAQQWCQQSSEVRELVAIARRSDNWLLYDISTKKFSLAFAPNEYAQPFSLLGFSSNDALAEWLG